MALNVGDVVYLNYGEVPATVHARLVLAVIDAAQSEYMILTPDADIYVEILAPANPDIIAYHPPGPNNGLPVGVPRNQIYSFAPMTAREYANFMEAGRNEAAAELARRGAIAGPPIGGGPVPPPAPTWSGCLGKHVVIIRLVNNCNLQLDILFLVMLV